MVNNDESQPYCTYVLLSKPVAQWRINIFQRALDVIGCGYIRKDSKGQVIHHIRASEVDQQDIQYTTTTAFNALALAQKPKNKEDTKYLIARVVGVWFNAALWDEVNL